MSKRIDSPSTRWPGHVIMPDYMTFPQLAKWEAALAGAESMTDERGRIVAFYVNLLPAVLGIVQEWRIEGLPEDLNEENFPASTGLINWLLEAVTDLWRETNTVDPN